MTTHAPRLFGVQPKPPAPRDALFDALTEACGYRPEDLTADARGRVNKARKQLGVVGVTPTEVEKAAKAYRKLYPTMPVTPQSLTSNWPALMLSVRGETEQPGTRMVDGKLERWFPGSGWVRETL